jgi:hypothetical protein
MAQASPEISAFGERIGRDDPVKVPAAMFQPKPRRGLPAH